MFIFVFIVLYFIFLIDETNCLVELKFLADYEEKCHKSIFLYLKPGSLTKELGLNAAGGI